jgi:hypothetical protein
MYVFFIFIFIQFTLADDQFKNCDSNLEKEIASLIENDKSGILSKQFKLTMLKQYKKVALNNSSTIEQFIKQDFLDLKKLSKSNPSTLKELEKFYDKNEIINLSSVYDHIESVKFKSEGANYWNKSRRFNNKDISSYLLFDSLSNPKSDVTKMDIAITFFMQKVSDQTAQEHGSYSANHNLTNLSNHLARYAGLINGTKEVLIDDVIIEINDLEKNINDTLYESLNTIKKNLALCFKDDLWLGACKFDSTFLQDELQRFLLNSKDLNARLLGNVAKEAINNTLKNHKETNSTPNNTIVNSRMVTSNTSSPDMPIKTSNSNKNDNYDRPSTNLSLTQHGLYDVKSYKDYFKVFPETLNPKKMMSYIDLRKDDKYSHDNLEGIFDKEIMYEKQVGLAQMQKEHNIAVKKVFYPTESELRGIITKQMKEFLAGKNKVEIVVPCSTAPNNKKVFKISPFKEHWDSGLSGVAYVFSLGSLGDEFFRPLIIRNAQGQTAHAYGTFYTKKETLENEAIDWLVSQCRQQS